MENTIQPQDIIAEVKETIKLIKMSKGYNWEIKVFLAQGDDITLARLKQLNESMLERYGKKEETEVKNENTN